MIELKTKYEVKKKLITTESKYITTFPVLHFFIETQDDFDEVFEYASSILNKECDDKKFDNLFIEYKNETTFLTYYFISFLEKRMSYEFRKYNNDRNLIKEVVIHFIKNRR